jgi:phosphoenolpyruvate carboxylase
MPADFLIKFMAGMLGKVIARQEGDASFELVEKARVLAREFRKNHDPAKADELSALVEGLPLDQLNILIKSFTNYFGMANLAEKLQAQESLALDPEASHPLRGAVAALKAKGLNAAELRAFFLNALVMPVFTAHPTESKRRTTLKILHRLTRQAARLAEPGLSAEAGEARRLAVLEEMVTLWQSDEVRRERPSVLIECRRNLFYFEEALAEAVPRIYRELEEAIALAWGDEAAFHPAAALRFGTWIGGDRDGNPFVTPEVTADVICEMRDTALGLHMKALMELSERLSLSSTQVDISPALAASLKEDGRRFPSLEEEMSADLAAEPYRRKVFYMREKMKRSALQTKQFRAEQPGRRTDLAEGSWYHSRHQFLKDLDLMSESLREHKASVIAEGFLQDVRRKAEVFGLQLARMDIRQHSSRHEAALAELLKGAGECDDFAALNDEQRCALIEREISEARPLARPGHPLSPEAAEVMETLRKAGRLLEELDPEAFQTYIVSMTHSSGDILGLLLLMRENGIFVPGKQSRFDLVPLFETKEDLDRSTEIMARLYASPAYRDHLRLRGEKQEIMLGYSDSNKEVGYVASRWHLYKAQVELRRQAEKAGLTLTLFHGRGGSVGRGGGPSHRAILAQPPDTVKGRIRITEQGEVVSDHYAEPGWASAHLEAMLAAVLLASHADKEQAPEPAWEAVLAELAERSLKAYRGLVYESPGFNSYFRQATPINEISRARIGSRPASRASSGDPAISELRAIPWVFAWTQSRHILAGWYGLGSALEGYLVEHPEGLATLRAMNDRWPFFNDLLSNAQMALKKADLAVMRRYAGLVEDETLRERYFGAVASEYKKSVENLCRVAGVKELLENEPALKASLEARNTYIDPLSAIQIELLRRVRRKNDPETEHRLEEAMLLCINGIAAGLKNTG